MICKNCGVELENDMPACPLCGRSVNDQQADGPAYGEPGALRRPPMNKKQRKFTWEIISIILASGIAAAFIVDLIIIGRITWSEYTTATGLVIFCYVSVFAFMDRGVLAEMASGFILSSLGFLLLDSITGGLQWALRLAVPLLLCLNIIGMLYTKTVQSARFKGINLVAYAFLGAALLCICTEVIVSIFMKGEWRLSWSVIVAACALPVVIILIFIHFRLKKGQNLKRTFHI